MHMEKAFKTRAAWHRLCSGVRRRPIHKGTLSMPTTQEAPHTAPQRMEFRTELKQLLDLIIHSLYTKKEIFLRELISNAADAIDKVRFEALTKPELVEGNSDWRIKLIADEQVGTLTISDNGIGMS